MPKSAAVMLGLALVAFSIGFNTVRYPVVWEMACPTGPSQGATATSNADSPPPSAETQQPPPPRPAEPPKPIAVARDRQAAEADSSSPHTASTDDAKTPTARPETEKTLVPVAPVSLSSTSAADAAVERIRRLPPVTTGYITPPGAVEPLGTSIPVYPTTGIE